jgi:hypothetical protein
LADGTHEVQLDVWDATLANRVRHGPFTITVDNVPPPRATTAPRIYGGAAREGTTLYADDGTWTGANLALARRWQRREDGAWEDITDATTPAYTPTGEDAGHRLRFRVRATNAEGTTDAFSEPTALLPPPPAPSPAPAATATPAPAAVVIVTPAVAPAAAAAPGTAAEPPLLAFPTAAFQTNGQSTITVHWGERRRVSGTLMRPDGRPVAGARVAITSRIRALDAEPLPLGHTTTDSAGHFAYTVGAGVSRIITFGFRDAAALRTAAVTIRVIPHVTVRPIAGGGVRGRVTGSPAGLRKVVDLQALRGHTWRSYATTRLTPTGGTFTAARRPPSHRVRALVRTDPGWPFLTGRSKPVTVQG